MKNYNISLINTRYICIVYIYNVVHRIRKSSTNIVFQTHQMTHRGDMLGCIIGEGLDEGGWSVEEVIDEICEKEQETRQNPLKNN